MGVRETHMWSELWSTSLKCKRSLCGISGTCLKAPLSAFSLEISARSHNPPSSHQTPSHTTMNYPQTTTDPYAFSFWPDAAAFSEEETMAWAQAAGYAQPGLTTDNFSFDDLGATAAWGQSATLPDGTFGIHHRIPSGPSVVRSQQWTCLAMESRSRMLPRQIPWGSRRPPPFPSLPTPSTAWTRSCKTYSPNQ
ncbi:hypothetical protein EDB92DRAFT_1836639 [Lactarius akahatsu]|uniref:Uncharacterized protein n=1 Tax=Lactarius akahatsu TaxID=416441 RepID=A0AAD4QH19_9AGAM|nr:hypothetical protein EDB92DRAFT_1836639 [Lactarius akahatsu]